MPALLFVFFSVFYLNFYLQGEALCALSSIECAITGHETEVPDLLFFTKPQKETSDGSDRTVRITAELPASFLQMRFTVDTNASYEKPTPATWLRRFYAGRDLLTGGE